MGIVVSWIYVFVVITLQLVIGVELLFCTPSRRARAGFKTKTTVANDETWNFANKKLGLAFCCLGIVEIPLFACLMHFLLGVNLLAAALPIILIQAGLIIAAAAVINALAKKYVK